jgi:CBS domain-containing protein
MARLAEILRKRPPVVNIMTPQQNVADAVQTMADRHVGAVLVVEAGRLVGIFSERDVLRRVLAEGIHPETTVLRSVMTRDPVTASPDDERMSAVQKMQEIGCRHLPIINEEVVVDTVSIRDLLFDEIEERDTQIQELKRYIQGA